MPKCVVCNGTDFVKEEGFYYCTECQTRCKDEVEQVHETTWGDSQIREQKTKITKAGPKATDADDNWTTWEAYNHVLKGMVDEVISLGASPKLKIVVFQLWAQYLRRIEVAFMGTRRHYPKLGPLYQDRDARVLHSWPSESRTKKSDKSNTSVCSGETSLIARSLAKSRAKKALAKAEQDRRSLASSVTSETSGVASSASMLHRKNKYMTEEAFLIRQKKVKTEASKNKPWKSRVRIRYTQSTFLCKAKLLAIIHLGLILSGDEIHLSDLIRWIYEGHLSYCSITHFLPPKISVKRNGDLRALEFKNTCPGHSAIRKVGGQLVLLLGIKSLPLPHLPNLIRRYVEDLELPEELADFAINIWADCRPRMPLKSELKSDEVNEKRAFSWFSQEIPNYEGRAMAILVFAMKLIFGLDGLTEVNISDFARKANKILSPAVGSLSRSPNDGHDSSKKLFVWQDWVNYIEFRNSFISRWHYPTHSSCFPERNQISLPRKNTIPESPPSHDVYNYLRFYEEAVKYTFKRPVNKKEPEWMRFMVKQLEDMVDEIPPSEDIKIFEPSLTPFLSYMQTLKKEYVNRGINNRNVSSQKGPCHKLLSAQFANTSIAYILDPAAIVETLAKEQVRVTVVKGSALGKRGSKYVKYIEPIRSYGENNKAHNFMNVRITKDGVKSKKRKTFDLFQFGDKYKLLQELQAKEEKWSGVKVREGKLKANEPAPSSECKGTDKRSRTLRKKSKRGRKSVQLELKSGPMKTNDQAKKCLTLMMPYRQTWMLYGVFHDMPDEKFNDLCSRMPLSFNWLLRLCANMIEMSEVSLYSELVNVELVHKHFKKGQGVSVKGHRYENLRTNIAVALW